jgi:hypothetical protein
MKRLHDHKTIVYRAVIELKTNDDASPAAVAAREGMGAHNLDLRWLILRSKQLGYVDVLIPEP